MEIGYKVFRREVLQKITIEEDRFGFEPEITAKIARLHCRVYEVGVSYSGRTYAEAKRSDGVTEFTPSGASSSTTFAPDSWNAEPAQASKIAMFVSGNGSRVSDLLRREESEPRR